MGVKRKKENAILCHRCQRWGHVAKNCDSQYNCVKCDHEQEPGQCKRKKSDPGESFCVKFKETDHRANWRGWSIFKKIHTKVQINCVKRGGECEFLRI